MSTRFPWRRLLRFRLRTLLMTLVAASLPLAWLAQGLHTAKRQREAVAVLESAGGLAYYDHELDARGALHGDASPLATPASRRINALTVTAVKEIRERFTRPENWRRRLLGDDFFDRIERVDLSYCNFHGSVLEALPALPELRVVNLSYTNVTDEDLAILARLPRLEVLGLAYTEIGDAGIRRLAGAEDLKQLALTATQVTDAGLRELEKLPSLERLSLERTQVTEEGIARLQRKLPDCTITHDGQRKFTRAPTAPDRPR